MAEGCVVRLITNLNVSAGLANSASGTFVKVIYNNADVTALLGGQHIVSWLTLHTFVAFWLSVKGNFHSRIVIGFLCIASSFYHKQSLVGSGRNSRRVSATGNSFHWIYAVTLQRTGGKGKPGKINWFLQISVWNVLAITFLPT